MDPLAAAALALAGAAVGYAARVIEGWLKARWDRDREREARQEARRDRLDELQRSTLLELQEALQELGRRTAQVHIAMRKTDHLDATDPSVTLVPDELEEEQRVVYGRALLLAGRLRDPALKETVRGAIRASANVGLTTQPRERADRLGEFFDARDGAERALEGVLAEYL